MNKKRLKKLLIGLVGAAVVAFSAPLAACETPKPRAVITFEFNQTEYEVEYTLQRDPCPHTVRLFIELAYNGYYHNTVIHDFKTNDWFTGGYSYDAEEYAARANDDGMGDYLTKHSKYNEFMSLFNDNKLSVSVYGNHAYDSRGNEIPDESTKLHTLLGEFKSNIQQTITNDRRSANYGCLKMYYYKDTTEDVENSYLYVTPTPDQIIMANYKNNNATSLFGVQMGDSSSYGISDYAVFAMLSSDAARDRLEDLEEAVHDYENYGTISASVNVNVGGLDGETHAYKDKFIEQTFSAPNTAIVIKSVKITKY